ncbi:MAG: HNH endonuclease [Thermomicrobiales bacterium]|nr:HNH endonuclease [Thermomicrobiales bacterium]
MAMENEPALTANDREQLIRRLFEVQLGRCFICEEPIDLDLHAGKLDVDHVQPKSGPDGKDDPANFALTHSSCNRSKLASDLRVARVLARFERIGRDARSQGREAPNLGDVLSAFGGARYDLPISLSSDGRVRYSFKHLAGTAGIKIQESNLHQDQLAQMDYFFAVLPLEYIHHDSKVNPRGIGKSLRGLVEEFYKGNPQLHVALGWVPMEADGDGRVMLFDGQHKAAAQILLGQRTLPVRVFVDPDIDRLIETNTNAGSTLRQVAFDKSILRHLGSELYADRVRKYQHAHHLSSDDESFSETDLVKHFAGEARAVRRYVVDAVRDQITQHPENRLRSYIEFSGKGTEKPISYSTIDKTFFSLLVGQDMLSTPIGQGTETGENPRVLEVEQIVRLMNLVAESIFEGQYDFEIGTYQLEAKVQKGEDVPESHLRAFRMGKEEVMAAWLKYVQRVIDQYYLFNGLSLPSRRVFQVNHPELLWERLRVFLHNLAGLSLWTNRELSLLAFGGKQPAGFWDTVFETGRNPQGAQVLPEPLNINALLAPA